MNTVIPFHQPKTLRGCTSTAMLIVFLLLATAGKAQIPFTKTKVKTPFGTVVVAKPVFDQYPKLNIKDFGAIAGDKEKISKAIEDAITKANQQGGATVVIPAGQWLTKKIHLKSNVNLHLEKDAELLFSEDPADYLPAVHTTWEGMECYNYSPLVYAYECNNVAITGEGKLKAKLDIWKVWYARPDAHMQSLKRLYDSCAAYSPVKNRQMVDGKANFRPQFIQFNRCNNVLLEGVAIENSPFWVIHPYLSKNVTIQNVNIYAHGHNNDGVDPEMSQNVLVQDCIFDQGDDAIAVKSGRDHDAWRLKTPAKNVVIRNCTIKNGHQLLAIGSEISGGIEKVFMDNCTVVDGAKLNHLVFVKTNERRGGYIKDIYVSNIKSGRIDQGVLGIETDVLYQWKDLMPTYDRKLTPITNVRLENVSAGEVQFISRILGEKELPVKDIKLLNVKATPVLKKDHIHANVMGFQQR